MAVNTNPYYSSGKTPDLSQAKVQLTAAGNQSFGSGQQTYNQGLQDFGPALDYWNSILSGNKAEMESAIAPEKNDILSQYRAKRKQMAATGSRSGGTNEAVAQSEFSQAGDVAGLMQKLRPQAAQQSSAIAGQITDAGLKESDMGMQAIAQMLQAGVTERGQTIGILQSIL
jgi:hypothetical protein